MNDTNQEIIHQICEAIRQESQEIPDADKYRVIKKEARGEYSVMTVAPYDNFIVPIREDYTSIFWMTTQYRIPELVNIDFRTNELTFEGIQVYRIKVGHELLFCRLTALQLLQPLWENEILAKRALDCFYDLKSPTLIDNKSIQENNFYHPTHKAAFNLVNYSCSFLWTPPGTNREFALAAVIADYLHSFPGTRVLFLANTNEAVDLATLALDKLLGSQNIHELRLRLKRIGPGWDRKKYADPYKKHLISALDRDTERQQLNLLYEYERQHGVWELIPDELMNLSYEKPISLNPQTISESRFLSMTTTIALQHFNRLGIAEPFDLVVFDEANHIGIPQSLMLMQLGKARMFSGDLKQLPPATKTRTENVQKWLGSSMLEYMPKISSNVYMLTESTGIAQPICDFLSKLFYDNQLHATLDIVCPKIWLKFIHAPFGSIPRNSPILIEKIPESKILNLAHSTNLREESALLIIKHIQSILSNRPPFNDVLIITPFQAQRDFLKIELERLHLDKVRVSPVHGAEIGSASVVFFDPVDANHEFFTGKLATNRLCAAFSAAKQKLILMLSDLDLRNPLFSKVNSIVSQHDNRAPRNAAEIFDSADYELSAVGQRIQMGDKVLDILEVDKLKDSVTFIDVPTGTEGIVKLSYILSAARCL